MRFFIEQGLPLTLMYTFAVLLFSYSRQTELSLASLGRDGVGSVPARVRRTRVRCLKAVPCSETETSLQYRGSRTSLPSTLRLVLLNARSVSNKAQVIQDLILEEDTDLACITETWIGGEGGPPLALICPPGYAVQHQGRLEGRGGSSHCP